MLTLAILPVGHVTTRAGTHGGFSQPRALGLRAAVKDGRVRSRGKVWSVPFHATVVFRRTCTVKSSSNPVEATSWFGRNNPMKIRPSDDVFRATAAGSPHSPPTLRTPRGPSRRSRSRAKDDFASLVNGRKDRS